MIIQCKSCGFFFINLSSTKLTNNLHRHIFFSDKVKRLLVTDSSCRNYRFVINCIYLASQYDVLSLKAYVVYFQQNFLSIYVTLYK